MHAEYYVMAGNLLADWRNIPPRIYREFQQNIEEYEAVEPGGAPLTHSIKVYIMAKTLQDLARRHVVVSP